MTSQHAKKEEAPVRGLFSILPIQAWLAMLATVLGLVGGGLLGAQLPIEATDQLPSAMVKTGGVDSNAGAGQPTSAEGKAPIAASSGMPASNRSGAFSPATEPEPFVSLNARADDLAVVMTVFPARAGPSEVNFFYFDTDGDDRSVEKVVVRIVYLDFSVSPITVGIDEGHPGHAYLIGNFFPHSGNWRVDLAIARKALPVARTRFDLSIR